MTVPRKSRQHFSYTSNGDATVNIPLRIKSIHSLLVFVNGSNNVNNAIIGTPVWTNKPPGAGPLAIESVATNGAITFSGVSIGVEWFQVTVAGTGFAPITSTADGHLTVDFDNYIYPGETKFVHFAAIDTSGTGIKYTIDFYLKFGTNFTVSDIRTESPYFFAFTCNPPLKKDDEVIIFQNYLIQREHDYASGESLTAEGYNKYEDDLTIMIHDLDQNVNNLSMRFAPQYIESITVEPACIIGTPVWTDRPTGVGPLAIKSIESNGVIIFSGVSIGVEIFVVTVSGTQFAPIASTYDGLLVVDFHDYIAPGETKFVNFAAAENPGPGIKYTIEFNLRIFCTKLDIPVPEGPGIRSLSWNPQGEWEFDASTPSSILDDLAVNSSESAAGANMVGYYTGEEGSTVQEGIMSKWELGVNEQGFSGADYVGYYDGEAGKLLQEAITSKYNLSINSSAEQSGADLVGYYTGGSASTAQAGIVSKYTLASADGCRKIGYDKSGTTVNVQSELTSIRNLLTVLESGCECPAFAEACIVGTVHWDNKPATSGTIALGTLDTAAKTIEITGFTTLENVWIQVTVGGTGLAPFQGGPNITISYGDLAIGSSVVIRIEAVGPPTYHATFTFKLGCPAP